MPWVAAAVTIGLQISYPLTSGDQRAAVTVFSVVAFFTASVSATAVTHGPARATAAAGAAGGIGLLAEAVGVHSGWPFGDYSYGTALGPKLAGVPVVVPLAWTMMGLPALMLGRRCAARLDRTGRPAAARRATARRAVTALAGGATLTAWDLFLDPQMVAEDYWSWESGGGPALNGIPVSNAAGWLLVGIVVTGALAALLPESNAAASAAGPGGPAARTRGRGGGHTGGAGVPADPGRRVLMVLLVWTYLSSVLANLAFFGRPGVALAGGVAMGMLLGLGVLPDRRGAARRGNLARSGN
ncbi:carotenoid biosynthesis protein [Parafrankia elaeagni]|uniref:carotenoid biosynthesis protein n=1 Tax=Parafrankia elaeagni TaxID=222534 RepID=UPI001E58C257|nr:carotenoid biosynthesis protein [Parafrankia elaeagni]